MIVAMPMRDLPSRQPLTTMSTPKQRTFFGRLWRSALLGVADGVPGVSQVVTAIEHMGKKDTPPIFPRLVAGWSTVVLMGMLLAARIWGGFGWSELKELLALLATF